MSTSANPAVRCLREEEWPPPDRLALRRSLQDDDLLQDAGALAGLRPRSIACYCSCYGRWLRDLTVWDPGALTEAPCARITPGRVGAYVARLQQTDAPLTVVDRLQGLKRMAQAFDPAGDWRWLGKRVNKLAARARPVRDKRSRLRPPDEVFQAALWLCRQAEEGSLGFTSLKKRALAHRDGLLLAVLASRAPRVSNLAMIEIGRHLRLAGGVWTLCFAGSEMKNGIPLTLALPEELTEPIRRHLDHWRPILLDGRRSDRLWVSTHKRPLDAKSVHEVVTVCTRRLLGVAMFPHLMRSALMTETAIRDPQHVGIASPILGHRSPRTKDKYYNLARQHEAVRDFQALALRLRRSARLGNRGLRRAGRRKKA
jgi:integrase